MGGLTYLKTGKIDREQRVLNLFAMGKEDVTRKKGCREEAAMIQDLLRPL